MTSLSAASRTLQASLYCFPGVPLRATLALCYRPLRGLLPRCCDAGQGVTI
jgi:hypothetical protein